jgi:predicted methyltransferase
MSKFGEDADMILEVLHNGEKVDLIEIKDRIAPFAIIDFMSEFGLIELNEGTVRITKSGLELLG